MLPNFMQKTHALNTLISDKIPVILIIHGGHLVPAILCSIELPALFFKL
jgi:hypothetical protein